MRTAIALIAPVLLSGLAPAQQELFKLTASDAAAADRFGVSVAMSAGRAVVGARDDDDNGSGSGSAYIFDVTSGQELFKLIASDGAADDRFGVSVAISGDLAVVGAFDHAGPGSGSAYLFDVTTGQELSKLTASDGALGPGFGYSVSIGGGRAVVGAYRDDDIGNQSGSAYVFDVSTRQELFKLTASDGNAYDRFGYSVSISGDRAVVGTGGNGDNGPGSAYVFDLTTGQERFKLTASDASAEDRFGWSVAISGDLAVVGAFNDDDNGPGSGSAYVFDVTTGQELFKLTASDGDTGDYFGRAVSVSDDSAVVGAWGDGDNGWATGSAYLFDVTTGQELSKLTASDGTQGAEFGNGVSISGDRTAIGASGDDNLSGSVYLFGTLADCNGNGIPDHNDIANGTSTDCDGNGRPDECDLADDPTLDCQSNGILDSCDIAADPSLDCDGNGALDSCEIATDPSLDQNNNGALDSCECLTQNYCIAAGNSTGAPAAIGWSGSVAITDTAFTLEVTDAVPFQFGLFFYAREQDFTLFGEGALCVEPPIYRLLPVILTDGNGFASYTVDYDEPPASGGPGAIDPFSTWNFQYWYRDPLGGPAGFNLSDGLEVTFCP